ncbi:MAG: hypothetical protein K0S53_1085 [Bacteroidetes bacterium]|nr:hypothetical protein [Bacteroidota bacterium]
MLKRIDYIISNVLFKDNYICENELRKAGLLRILAGVIIFVRFFEILVSQIHLYGYTNATYFLIASLFAIAMFTIGFLTPIVNLLVLIVIPILDAKLVTNTLGSTIAINLLIVLFLINSGQFYSLDRVLFFKKNKFSNWIQKVHMLVGAPDLLTLKRAYFLGFILYAISSLFALLLHVEDPHWLNAVTVRAMLTNSFLCKHAFWFRDLEVLVPGLLDVLSIIGVIFQSCFQILMIPLLFFKFGKIFIKIWGFIFFVTSLFFLSLSYLPHIELILWIILFCPLHIPKERIRILYDDKCNLCKQAMRFFKWININEIYEFLPVSQNRQLYEKYSLTEAEVKTYMVGFYKGKILKGYDLYLYIIGKNPALMIFYPVFFIGKITLIGPYIYNLVAKNRYKLMDRCEISFDDILQKKSSFFVYNSNTSASRIVYTFYFICILLFISTNNGLFRTVFQSNAPVTSFAVSFKKNCRRIGIEVPVVFNNTDLSMGDSFMTIKKRVNNEWRLLPITGKNGERLNYMNYDILLFTNHNSDMLYFGQTLKYRRALINGIEDPVKFHEYGFGKRHIDFLIKYDYAVTKESSPVEYKLEVFTSRSSKVELFKNDQTRHSLMKVYEKNIIYKN